MSKRNILVIEDELENREVIREVLQKEYNVFEAETGEEGLEIALKHTPHLVLLDLKLPKKDGISICEALRTNPSTMHIPIIILTGNPEPDARVQSFLTGADDFLSKPFSPRELLARIQSKFRRLEEKERPPKVIDCGNLHLDLDKLQVSVAGREERLSVLEFKLLKYFVEHRDIVVSRETILNSVWKDSVVTERTVDTHLVSLRKLLKGCDYQLTTVYGAGYIFKKS